VSFEELEISKGSRPELALQDVEKEGWWEDEE